MYYIKGANPYLCVCFHFKTFTKQIQSNTQATQEYNTLYICYILTLTALNYL
jgi:hypothetical protein